MIVLENGDLIEGDATSASEVDFTIHGLDNNTLKQMADGQLANSKGTIYTADSTDVVSSIILVNTGAVANAVNLYLKPSGGTSRRLIAKDLQLESGFSLHFDGAKIAVIDTTGQILSGVGTGVFGPATNTDLNVPQWNGADSKTLKDGLVVGTGANNLVQLDASSKLPSVDGSQLTNLSSGGGLTWSLITANPSPAVKDNGYLCNTTAGAFPVTLPAAPDEGDIVAFADAAGTFNTNNLTVGRNSLKIMALEEDLIISTKWIAFQLVYASAALGWRIA